MMGLEALTMEGREFRLCREDKFIIGAFVRRLRDIDLDYAGSM